MRKTAPFFVAICFVLVVLSLLEEKLPAFARNLLTPGFVLAIWINGSLHDRIMRGYAVWAFVFNCIFYCSLLIAAIRLYRLLSKSD